MTRREIVRRTHARQAVRAAGLPLLRAIVDRARVLLDEHADVKNGAGEVAVDALQIEFGRRAL